ncbi:glutathione S-transferase omega-1-like [Liolophura sinensis]|uniref:glutathione S-transferase omega-1-like n=1 Tax=Liolophura sinensis TaxID=3198878 RepID=UPI00315802C5
MTVTTCLRKCSLSKHLKETETMAMPTEKSFAKGTKFPPLKPGSLRLYSMRFCPFAQRTRLLLEHKNIPYETVNINLKQKPDWFLQRNPLGLVPVLEHDEKVVYESLVCNEYLEDIYPKFRCSPRDPYLLALDRMVVERSNWFISRFYKVLLKDQQKNETLDQLEKALDVLEKDLSGRGKFLAGNAVGNLDFLLWPWFERLCVVEVISGFKFTEERFPKLFSWMKNMNNLPAVQKTAFDVASHLVFVKSLKDRNPNYDYGLPVSSKL